MKLRLVALVPMRHHSERVPGKNYRPFADRELYHHIMGTLLDCELIDEVVVNTDSPRIMEDVSEHFPQVRLIERPESLRAPTVPMNDVLLYDVTQAESDYYLQTHSTNPLLQTETVTRAIRLPWMDRIMRQGHWTKLPSIALRECTLGVIGVGNVGKAVVRRATAFGMRVLGNDLVEMPYDFLAENQIEMVSKEDLLQQAEFVSLNCTLNPTSFHLISDNEFALMKSTAVIINTARGQIIDEPALIRALQNELIAGAAMDVFETESLPAESPLLYMDNVMLAPHNSNSSPEAWERVHQNTVQNLLQVLEKELCHSERI